MRRTPAEIAPAAATSAAAGRARAAARPTGRFRLVPRVARDAVDLVVGMRAQAELRRVGLADKHRALPAQALRHDAVVRRHVARQRAAAHRRHHAGDSRQILGRLRKTMHPAARQTLRQQHIALTRLVDRPGRIHTSHHSVDRWVEAIDLGQEGFHDLHAGNVTCVDALGQLDRAPLHDLLVRRRMCCCGGQGDVLHGSLLHSEG